MKACPHGAVHLIGVTGGLHANTPFVDPYHAACVFCEDMPCIDSCEPKALTRDENGKYLKMGTAVFYKDHCLVGQGQRCDYCFNSCPQGIKAISKTKEGMPQINADLCVGCGKCAYICVSQTGKAFDVIASDHSLVDESSDEHNESSLSNDNNTTKEEGTTLD